MIHFVIGTRAQLIKTAPLMAECQKLKVNYNFIFLAQHKESISDMINMFAVKKPDRILGDIGKDITSVNEILPWAIKTLCKAIANRRNIFREDTNGVAVIHGDAPPVLLGAVIAKIAGLKVAYVEAGLRSFNFLHPFPEELIRVVTSRLRLVDFYFCPNQWALDNLGKNPGQKYNTEANTLADSLNMALKNSSETEVNIPLEKYAIVSIHRFETISRKERLEQIVEILNGISDKIKLVFILHPPTTVALKKYDFYEILGRNPNVELRPRYSYFKFITLLTHSQFAISDGGSNQEECSYLGHPCLLLRHKTERTEGLGKNIILSNLDAKVINDFVNNYENYKTSPFEILHSPSKMIIETLRSYWDFQAHDE